MRKLLLVVAVAATISLSFGVSHGPAAPALADKPVKYEFAELRYVRTAGGGNFGGGMPAGFPAGGVGGQGGRGPGGGFGGQAVPVVTTTIRFCTGDDEIEASEWKELGDKLKAPGAKERGVLHRSQIASSEQACR